MIQLTRLNNTQFLVNSDLIKFVEESPDTFVTLTTGEKIVVREKSADVLARMIQFRKSVLEGLHLCWDPSSPQTAEPRVTSHGSHGSEK